MNLRLLLDSCRLIPARGLLRAIWTIYRSKDNELAWLLRSIANEYDTRPFDPSSPLSLRDVKGRWASVGDEIHCPAYEDDSPTGWHLIDRFDTHSSLVLAHVPTGPKEIGATDYWVLSQCETRPRLTVVKASP